MYFQEKKRERIALETLNLFSPIADRLGLHQFKNALDEECFKVLNPENYKRLKNELEKLRPRKETFLKTTKKKIKSLLD
jgi:(p)ppGpp synthase/HD superfamily hydrolase